jgi:hypothetical protein
MINKINVMNWGNLNYFLGKIFLIWLEVYLGILKIAI